MISVPILFAEEALEALLTRVRWYWTRGYDVPEQTARAFNHLCDALDKPNARPYERIPGSRMR